VLRTVSSALVSPVSVLSVSALSWRRSAALPCQAHLEAARVPARAVDQPARHSASPAALALMSRRAVPAAWDVLVRRREAQEARRGAPARPVGSGAAAALLPEAGALRV
jgi:hypothetical protein